MDVHDPKLFENVAHYLNWIKEAKHKERLEDNFQCKSQKDIELKIESAICDELPTYTLGA